MSEPEESLLKRIRDSVIRAGQTPARNMTLPPMEEVNVRDSVRQLARSRVSATLRQLRAVRGYSYEQVKERTGLPQQLLYDMEYKDRRLTLDELSQLARCYGISINDVLGIDLEQ